MKTVRDACQLQPNALSVKLSDQIEQLDELITAEGDGAAFFEKTHITLGMRDLIAVHKRCDRSNGWRFPSAPYGACGWMAPAGTAVDAQTHGHPA